MENREIISKSFPLEQKPSVYYYKLNTPKLKKNDENKSYTFICLHDLHSHHESFNPMIEKLINIHNDYSFLSLDFLGHGLSNGTRGQMGEFDRIAGHLDKILEKEKKNDGNVILLGDGIGASLLIGYLQKQNRYLKESLKGCVILNPKFTYGFNIPHWAKYLFNKVSKNIENIRIPLNEINQIINGYEELKHLPGDDPLIIKTIPLSVLFELENYVSTLKGIHYFLDTPLFFLLSRKENSRNLQKIEQFYKGIPSNKKRLEYYLSTNFYNNISLNKITEDIHNWVSNLS